MKRRIAEYYDIFSGRIVDNMLCLWCDHCRCSVNSQTGHVTKHLSTKKHLSRSVYSAEPNRIAKLQEMRYIASHPKDSSWNIDRSIIKSLFDQILQHADHGMLLTSTSCLSNLVPFLLEVEQNKLMDEVKDCDVFVIIEKPALGETDYFSVIFRYVTPDFHVSQRLVHMEKILVNPTITTTTPSSSATTISVDGVAGGAEIEDKIVASCASYHKMNRVLASSDSDGASTGVNDTAVASHGDGRVLGFQGLRMDPLLADSEVISSLISQNVIINNNNSNKNNNIGSKQQFQCCLRVLQQTAKSIDASLLESFATDLRVVLSVSKLANSNWSSKLGINLNELSQAMSNDALPWVYQTLHSKFDRCIACIRAFSADPKSLQVTEHIERLQASVSDLMIRATLKLELEVVVGLLNPIVHAAHIVSSDGPTALITWKVLTDLRALLVGYQETLTFGDISDAINKAAMWTAAAATAKPTTPNGSKVVPNSETLSTFPATTTATVNWEGNVAEQEAAARAKIQPAIRYFDAIMSHQSLEFDLKIYKAARWANPIHIAHEVDPDPANLTIEFMAMLRTELCQIESLSHDDLNAINQEWPQYVQLCHLTFQDHDAYKQDLNYHHQLHDASHFWKEHATTLPGCAKLARYAFALSVSSSAIQRLHSLRKVMHLSGMDKAAEDDGSYLLLSCLRRFNGRVSTSSTSYNAMNRDEDEEREEEEEEDKEEGKHDDNHVAVVVSVSNDCAHEDDEDI